MQNLFSKYLWPLRLVGLAFLHYAGFIHGHRTSGYIRKFGGKLCNPLDIHGRQEKILSLVYCLLIIRKDMDTGGNHGPGTSH